MPNCHTKRGGKYAIKREVSTSRMFRIDILGLILSQNMDVEAQKMMDMCVQREKNQKI